MVKIQEHYHGVNNYLFDYFYKKVFLYDLKVAY